MMLSFICVRYVFDICHPGASQERYGYFFCVERIFDVFFSMNRHISLKTPNNEVGGGKGKRSDGDGFGICGSGVLLQSHS